MTNQEFLEYCLDTYGTSPDYPFDEDFETAVLRHKDNRKWYAIVMKVSRRKFGFDSEAISLGEAKFHSPQANFVEKREQVKDLLSFFWRVLTKKMPTQVC